MSDLIVTPDPALSKHRLEALSDGVFAVVLTLLVLEIKPEIPLHAGNAEIVQALRDLTRPLFGYALAFAITGIFWTLHNRKFSLLRHTNGLHSALTLVFLFAVTLLPLSISIYLRAMSAPFAQALYFGNFALIAVTLLASWTYAQQAGLADLSLAPKAASALTRRMIVSSGVGVVACAVAWSGQTLLLVLLIPVVLWFRLRRHHSP